MYDYNDLVDIVANNPLRLSQLSPALMDDPNFIFQAAIRNPAVLSFASPNLINQKDLYKNLVMQVGAYQPNVIMYVINELKNDTVFLGNYLTNYPQAFPCLKGINTVLYYDANFVASLYQRNQKIANYAPEYREFFSRVPLDVISRSKVVIDDIMAWYHNLESYKGDAVLTMNKAYIQMDYYMNTLSDSDYETLMNYEVDGKPLKYYYYQGGAYNYAGMLAYRLSKNDEKGIREILAIVESKDCVVKDLMDEQYPKHGLTSEMLDPYRKKKKKSSAKGGKKSSSSRGSDEDLDRDDIELPVIPEKDYPSDYTLNEMIAANVAQEIDNSIRDVLYLKSVERKYRDKEVLTEKENNEWLSAIDGFIMHLEDVMGLVNHYRQAIYNFDGILANTKSLEPGVSSLEALFDLEREAVEDIFVDIERAEYVTHDQALADNYYNEAVDNFDEDIVKAVFYADRGRKSAIKRIDKRNGYKVKKSSPKSEFVGEGKEIDAVVSQLKSSLDAILHETMTSGVIDSPQEIKFLKLYNQTKGYIKISPEIATRLNKAKYSDGKLFNDKMYELQYMCCQVHVYRISKYMSAGKYDLIAKEFNYLINEQYPIDMIKGLCDEYVLNFVSLKRITYGKLNEYELDREAENRTHNNPVESVIEQLRKINDLRKKKRTGDIFKRFNEFLSDFRKLSNEQLAYLENSVTIDGLSFGECYWTNRLWFEASEISRQLKNGNEKIARRKINKIFELAKPENANIQLEIIKNAFTEFGLEKYYEEMAPKKEEGPKKPPETKPIKTEPSESEPRESTDGLDLETAYMFISSQISSIYQHLTMTLTSYSSWCQKSIERIGDRIKSGVMKNPELKNKLEKEIDPASGLSVMQMFMYADCLNKLRFARENDNKGFEEELAKRYGDIYVECCSMIRGRS